MTHEQATFDAKTEIDFVIIGAGAAGGIIAKELSAAGFRIVVLEQGPYMKEQDFEHDELKYMRQRAITNDYKRQPNTFRATEKETAKLQPAIIYGRQVGGGTVHFTANYWRFHEIDFIERSRWGSIAGSGFADWPITYAELEPYYTKTEWDLGVSGLAGASPFDPPRSKPYPLPPLPIKSSGVLAERGAKKLGWHAFPAPMAIISQPYRGRSACLHCGFCEYFGCEAKAKSSTLATVIREAEKTGLCEIRPNSCVRRIEVNKAGLVTGVTYFDEGGREHFQSAKAVVLCANGAETPRLLFLSKSSLFPNGLANSSGKVGKYLMFNGHAQASRSDARVLRGRGNGYALRVLPDELRPSRPATGRAQVGSSIQSHAQGALHAHCARIGTHNFVAGGDKQHLARFACERRVGAARRAGHLQRPRGRHEDDAVLSGALQGTPGSGGAPKDMDPRVKKSDVRLSLAGNLPDG